MNANLSENSAGEQMSSFLPLSLLACSFALILIFQIAQLLPQRSLLQNALVQNAQGVQQSKQVQASLQKLAMDLHAAAAEDKDAQAIITKYGIKVNGTPAPAASPALK